MPPAISTRPVSYSTATSRWIVRRSGDGGASWTTIDDFDRGGQPDGDHPSIAVDAAGDVYVSGVSYVSGSSVWTIRKGVGGTSFSTVDAMQSGNARGIFAHPTAGIFAVGTRSQSWTVRRSTDGGASWPNIETFKLGRNYASHAYGIGANALGHLYVVGIAYNRTGGRWLVRKSIDGGASFSTLTTFNPAETFPLPERLPPPPTGISTWPARPPALRGITG